MSLSAKEASKREAMGMSSASLMAFRALREGFTAPVSIWLRRLEEHLHSSAILAKVKPFSLFSIFEINLYLSTKK
jgi:hypothetical protein